MADPLVAKITENDAILLKKEDINFYSALALKTRAIDPAELRDVLTRCLEPADRLVARYRSMLIRNPQSDATFCV